MDTDGLTVRAMSAVRVATMNMLPGIYAGRYSLVAAPLFFTYDIVITLGDEIEHIWSAPWSLPKVLYLTARYYGLLTMTLMAVFGLSVNPRSQTCNGWFWFSQINVLLFLGGILNLLLFLRIYALYARSKIILYGLGTVYVGELVIGFVNTGMSPPIATSTMLPSGEILMGCSNGAGSRQVAIITQSLCLFRAALYLALTLWRWTRVMDEDGAASRALFAGARQRRRLGPLMALFVRDEVALFAVIAGWQIVQAVFTFKESLTHWKGVTYPWFLASITIVATRLVLNLRSHFNETRAKRATLRMAAHPAHSDSDTPFGLRKTELSPSGTGSATFPGPGITITSETWQKVDEHIDLDRPLPMSPGRAFVVERTV